MTYTEGHCWKLTTEDSQKVLGESAYPNSTDCNYVCGGLENGNFQQGTCMKYGEDEINKTNLAEILQKASGNPSMCGGGVFEYGESGGRLVRNAQYNVGYTDPSSNSADYSEYNHKSDGKCYVQAPEGSISVQHNCFL